MKKKALRVLAGALGLGIVFYAAMGASALKVYAETEYEYDDLNRLTKERHDDGTVIYYSYDSNGNLLDVRIEDSNDTENENPDETPDKTPDNGSFGKTDPEPQEMMKPEKRKAMGKMSGEMVEITKQKTCR